MLSIEQTRALLNDPSLTDEDVDQISIGFRLLAELIFDKWFDEKRTQLGPTNRTQGDQT